MNECLRFSSYCLILVWLAICYGSQKIDSAVWQSRTISDSESFDVFAAIEKAKAMLADTTAGYQVKAEKVWTRNSRGKKVYSFRKKLTAANTMLALANTRGGEIKLVLFPPFSEGTVDSSSGQFVIQSGPNLGLGTGFSVLRPTGWLVARLKRAVNKPGGGFEEVDYTSYSPEIDLPELRQRGWQYCNMFVDCALALARERQIRSRAFPGRLVGEYIGKELPLLLNLNEHIDPQVLADNPQAAGIMARRQFVILGANQELTSRYAVSPAPAYARGRMQFIASTYQLVLLSYPDAGLLPDFVAGMNSHINATLAALCLFDSDLLALDEKKRRRLLQNPEDLYLFLAVAYNAGAGRARKAVDENGRFLSSRVTIPETAGYIQKLAALQSELRPLLAAY